MRKVMFALAIMAVPMTTFIPQSANAQGSTFFPGPTGSCCGQVNFGSYYSRPVYAPKRQASQPQVNGHARGACDSLCQTKCQASWRALGFRSVNACVARWAKLNAEGTAATCETAIKANGMRPIRGC